MNMLRKLFFWFDCSRLHGFRTESNADRVDRPNTKKINFGIKADSTLPCSWCPN